MISRDGIKVAMTTTGSATPGFEELRRNYRYNGDKPLEDTPAQQLAGGEARTERREKRIAEFAAALADLGETDPAEAPNPAVIEAGKRIGVGEKTAKSYRTAIRQQRQEAAGA